MNFHQAIQHGESLLRQNGVDDPRWNAERLLLRALHVSRAEAYAGLQRELTPVESEAYRLLIQRRAQHEPLAYIEGTQEFYGREFFVDSNVLIPRPETEEIIRAALMLKLPRAPRILDLGAGSGCIAVTLALEIASARVVALEVSRAAIPVLRRNGDGKIHVVRGDLISPPFCPASFDLIVSNPPYVEEKDYAGLPLETRHEPREALVPDSIEAMYSSLIRTAELLLQPRGYLIFEIGAGQESVVEELLSRRAGSIEKWLQERLSEYLTHIYLAENLKFLHYWSGNKMKAKMPRIKMKLTAPWALAGIAGFIAFNIGVSIYVERLLARPKRKRNRSSDLSDFVPEVSYETSECSFPSDDGVDLSALLMTPEKANGHIILVCHGLAHDKKSGVRYVQYLLKEGYTLMAIDFRNHGDSQGEVTTYGYFEKRDMHAAIHYLRKCCGYDARIGVLGASMGASIALQAAAETDEISGMVLDSPFASLKTITYEWADQMTHLPRFLLHVPMNLGYFLYEKQTHCKVPEIEPVEKVKNVRCPIFLIHGKEDAKIPAHHSRDIFEKAPGEKELWIAEDAGHLGTYLRYRHEYETRVIQFFEKTLRHKDTKVAQSL